ncbi:HprK-related kinase A [Roseateles toxinivorans]|uniref:Hpr(Ser) kinase/phosphatase n=1 Tax=Roseateles toxinivorans TaxID=270368 RepID=A0A4R6QUV9_9BURK|nr:HprK-related kinase A [Roseateles toxinivorans]TDP74595.1 Hpr(Ser) kinase/phosphatase [Roseateles toxinivorans]
MRLAELGASELLRRLRGEGLLLRTGPFTTRVLTPIDAVARGLELLYGHYPVLDSAEFADFTVTLARPGGLLRRLRPQVLFTYDGALPFEPLPIDHAFPLFEWAMNWCISSQAHQYLTLHAAVIERNGCAVIMPAPPGSGKSTLCAGLVSRGWRLLSDELALISLTDGSLTPLCRPISLKNRSIDIMKAYAPEAVFNVVTHDTSKGSVTHMKADPAHVARMAETARPRWIIFPKYVADAPAALAPRSRAGSLLDLGRNSFNYMVQGLPGFECLSDLVDACQCYTFEYSQLNDAVALFDSLARQESGE